MRRKILLVSMLACAAVSGGSFSPSARADTYSFASGIQSNAASHGEVCHRWATSNGAVGLYYDENACCAGCNQHYYMPLYWRNFYSASTVRSVTVYGRRASSSADMDCALLVYNANGDLVSSDSAEFTAFGPNYSSITLDVTNVLSTSTSVISCTIWTSGNAWLLSAKWTP